MPESESVCTRILNQTNTMADREKKKQGFTTVQTNTEELNKKIRTHRLKIARIILLTAVILILLTAAVMLFFRLREYTGYDVLESAERTGTAAAQYMSFHNGVIKYGSDGAVYTDSADELVWNQTYEMQEPLADVCENYVAFAEKGGKKIYILDTEKLRGSIETTMEIVKVRVANQGTVAVLMRTETGNYIHLYDRDGNDLAGGQISIKNTGFPLDIALSNDAVKLAVTMLDINEGNINSLIAFYNFGSVGQEEIDHMVGSCSYSDMVIPTIEFVTNDRMLAFGGSSILIFEGTQKPVFEKRVDVATEIRSLFYNNDYFGVLYNNEDEENTRHMEIYNTAGDHILSKDFALDYDTVEFLANNEICIRNERECQIYNTYGVKHFDCKFDDPLYKIISGASNLEYTFILEDTVEKVRIK